MTTNLISFIIPYQYHQTREPLLYATIDCILRIIKPYQPTHLFEICVHEVGVESTFNESYLNNTLFRYLFTYSPGIFNRAWTLNAGVKHLSSGHLLVLLDADIILPDNWLPKILNITSPTYGWNTLSYLNQETTKQYLDSPFNLWQIKLKTNFIKQKEPKKLCSAGGVIIIPSKIYHDIQGIPESFIGWGGCDNAFIIKLEAFNYHIGKLDCEIYHLYHPSTVTSCLDNSKLVNKMKQWSKSNWEGYNKEIDNWGTLNPPKSSIIDIKALYKPEPKPKQNIMVLPDKKTHKHSNRWRNKQDKWQKIKEYNPASPIKKSIFKLPSSIQNKLEN